MPWPATDVPSESLAHRRRQTQPRPRLHSCSQQVSANPCKTKKAGERHASCGRFHSFTFPLWPVYQVLLTAGQRAHSTLCARAMHCGHMEATAQHASQVPPSLAMLTGAWPAAAAATKKQDNSVFRSLNVIIRNNASHNTTLTRYGATHRRRPVAQLACGRATIASRFGNRTSCICMSYLV